MQKVKKVVKKETFVQGILALLFSQVIIKLLGLVYKLYLTNREGFGDAGNAIYGSGYQIYALLLTLSSIGVPGAIAKMISEKAAVGDNRGAHRIFKISLVTFGLVGLFGTCIMFFGARYISNVMLQIPEAELTMVALAPAIFFVAIASVIRGYFNGMHTMKATANSQTLEQVFKTFFTLLFVELIAMFTNANTTLMAAGATIATTLATFLSFGYLYLYYKSTKKNIKNTESTYVSNTRESVKDVLKTILIVSIPITITALLSTVNKNIDSFTVVGGLKTFITDENRAKELYGIISGKVDTLTTLPLSFNVAFSSALVPAVASAVAMKNKKVASEKISFTLLATILLGLPATVGMIIFAGPILKLLFPMQPEGTLVLQITSLTIISIALVQTINAALQGIGRVNVPAIALTIGVIIKFICNITLVPNPNFGINGAAIGSVLCYVVADLIAFIVLKRSIKIETKLSKFVIKPLLASLIMGIISYGLYINIINIIGNKLATIISLIVAVITYGLSIATLKILTKEEILMLPLGNKIYKLLNKLKIYN